MKPTPEKKQQWREAGKEAFKRGTSVSRYKEGTVSYGFWREGWEAARQAHYCNS